MAGVRPTGPTGPQIDPGYDPSPNPSTSVPLASVVGFVTEFNANTQIFGAAAVLLVTTMTKMDVLHAITSQHTTDITMLKAQLGQLMSAIARLNQLSIGGADSPEITRAPADEAGTTVPVHGPY